MAKITPLSDLVSLANQSSAITIVNTNNQRIEDALANTLSLDGSTPNSLGADFDVNGHRVLNLPEATTPTEPVRKQELDEFTLGVTPELLAASITSINANIASRDASAASAAASAASAVLSASYVGSAVSAPKWTTARNFSFTGDVTGGPTSVDGQADVSIALNIAADTVSDLELTPGAALANLGFTPANKAGDTIGASTFTGDVTLATGLTVLTQYSAGYRGVPVVTHDADYTFVIDDSGKMLRHTSGTGHAYTIPPNSAVAYPIGTAVLIRNVGTGNVTLTKGAGVTLRLAGAATDSNKVVAQWGSISAIKEAADTWVVTGAGVT